MSVCVPSADDVSERREERDWGGGAVRINRESKDVCVMLAGDFGSGGEKRKKRKKEGKKKRTDRKKDREGK